MFVARYTAAHKYGLPYADNDGTPNPYEAEFNALEGGTYEELLEFYKKTEHEDVLRDVRRTGVDSSIGWVDLCPSGGTYTITKWNDDVYSGGAFRLDCSIHAD